MTEEPQVLSRRERNRINTAAEIKDRARALMEPEGAASLSLRAIAREMGMTAPAIYRYFPSRDDLVTALIVDAYDSLADAINDADAPLARADLSGRLFAIARAYRTWAFAHRAEYSLIFGTPIIGYHAPFEITQPAAYRATIQLVDVITRAVVRTDGTFDPSTGGHTSLSALDDEVRHAAIAAWATMHGLVSLELFGHTEKLEESTDDLYDAEIAWFARRLGIDVSAGDDNRLVR
jgi:AcrR family transcriptional regulator